MSFTIKKSYNGLHHMQSNMVFEMLSNTITKRNITPWRPNFFFSTIPHYALEEVLYHINGSNDQFWF